MESFRGWAAGVAVVVAASGCLQSSVVECEDGTLCPAGLVCSPIGGCVTQDQLDQCATEPDMTTCTVGSDPGVCRDGVCDRAGCGDGFVVVPEVCEGADTTTCAALGYDTGGAVGCAANCQWDTTSCAGICNDGEVGPGEDCDGEDLQGLTDCQDLGYYDPQALTCNTLCHYDTTLCTGECGDQEVEGPELCEDTWTRAEQCVDFGYDAGALGCNAALCTADLSGCSFIGWRHVAVPLPPPYGAITGRTVTDATGTHDDLWIAAGGMTLHGDGVQWAAIDASAGDDVVFAGIWAATATPTDVWVAGTRGEIRRWDGASWQPEASGTVRDLAEIHGTGPEDVWAVGASGTIVHRDATGWTRLGTKTTASLTGVWAVAPDDVWVVGAAGAVLHNGTPISLGTSTSMATVWASASDDVWIGDVAGNVRHFDGSAWTVTALGLGSVNAIRGTGRRDVWAATSTGALAHFDGISWTRIGPVDFQFVASLWGDRPGDMWLAGSSVGHYPGRAWTETFAPAAALPIDDVGGTDAGNVWISAADGIRHFDGSAWTVANPGQSFWSASGTGPDDMWFASFQILRWDGTWSSVSTCCGVDAVWHSDADDVWALGSSWAHFDGSAWSDVTPALALVTDLWGTGPEDVWGVGDRGEIIHWDGAAWSAEVAPSGTALLGLWGTGPDDLWAVGAAGRILHHDGSTWTAVAPPWLTADLYDVWGHGSDDVWAVGAQATIVHWDGVAWSPVRSPVPPETLFWSVWGTPRQLFVAGDPMSLMLDASIPLRCRSAEAACGDAVDDDCDGQTDLDDPDCADAVRLVEIATGTEGFLEVVNRSAVQRALGGLAVAWQLDCDAEVRRKTFPTDAVAGPAERWRLVDTADDVRARERAATSAICDGGTTGWVALCAGPCDLTTCSNLIDYVATATITTIPLGLPCASFGPAPVDLTGIGAAQSVTRTAFTGSGPVGVAADWTIATATRD